MLIFNNDSVAKVDSRIFQSLVGSLIHLSNSRLDILFSVSIIFRFMEDRNRLYFAVAKNFLRYPPKRFQPLTNIYNSCHVAFFPGEP
jgi:hypothetical protein